MHDRFKFSFSKLAILSGVALSGAIFCTSLLVAIFDLLPPGHKATDFFYFSVMFLTRALPLVGFFIALIGAYITWKAGRSLRTSLIATFCCLVFFHIASFAIYRFYSVQLLLTDFNV